MPKVNVLFTLHDDCTIKTQTLGNSMIQNLDAASIGRFSVELAKSIDYTLVVLAVFVCVGRVPFRGLRGFGRTVDGCVTCVERIRVA